MAEDDKEEKLSPRVEKALAAARRAAKGERTKGTRGGRWLAFIPVTIGILLFALVMPRSTEPRDIPMPAVDGAALRKVTDADIARAARARASRLPDDILVLGTAIRQLNRAMTDTSPEAVSVVAQARVAVDDAKRALKKDSLEDILTLRAVQLDDFLTEVAKFESSGQESKELTDVGGTFVARMRDATWIDGSHVLLDAAQRRAAYKLVWNAVAGVTGPDFDLSVDEERVLYTLYIAHPHVPDSRLPGMKAELAQAQDEAACKTAHANEQRLIEMWRAEKIQKLAQLDPSYPTDYALGVAYYRAARYEQSIEAFRRWNDQHPDGPYALRARNHLRAALAAYGAL